MINAGQRLTVNNRNFGYLHHRIVFYLLNLHIKSRHTYFVRVSRMLHSSFILNKGSRLVQQAIKTRTRPMLTSLHKAKNMLRR